MHRRAYLGATKGDRIVTALLADTHQLVVTPNKVEVPFCRLGLEDQGDSAEVCGSILEM